MSQYPPNWESIAHQIRERDRFRCVLCGRNDLPLHVDHVRPISEGGSHLPLNLRTLCESCHIRRHPNMSMDPYWQQSLYTHETNLVEWRRWQRYLRRKMLFRRVRRTVRMTVKVMGIITIGLLVFAATLIAQTDRSWRRRATYKKRRTWSWRRTTRYRRRRRRAWL